MGTNTYHIVSKFQPHILIAEATAAIEAGLTCGVLGHLNLSPLSLWLAKTFKVVCLLFSAYINLQTLTSSVYCILYCTIQAHLATCEYEGTSG